MRAGTHPDARPTLEPHEHRVDHRLRAAAARRARRRAAGRGRAPAHRRAPPPAAAFRRHVEADAGDELDALAAELDGGPATALMCLEAEPGTCHRRILTDELRRRRPGLRVVDL
jgi:hypothetical protein